jgi:quinol monooxygenase YgiN
MLHVIATITVHPEYLVAATEVMKNLAQKSRQEPGCVNYAVFARHHEPVLVAKETWVDSVSEAAHVQGVNVAEAFQAIGAYLALPPEIYHHNQVI